MPPAWQKPSGGQQAAPCPIPQLWQVPLWQIV
jgi:hypothetical protein